MCLRYRTTEDEDDATLASETAGPREKVAARLLRIEKRILNGARALRTHCKSCLCYTPAALAVLMKCHRVNTSTIAWIG